MCFANTTEVCAEGHTGVVCTSCVQDDHRLWGGVCRHCTTTDPWFITFMVLVNAFIIFVLLVNNYRHVESRCGSAALAVTGAAYANFLSCAARLPSGQAEAVH